MFQEVDLEYWVFSSVKFAELSLCLLTITKGKTQNIDKNLKNYESVKIGTKEKKEKKNHESVKIGTK